jgi:GntR family transcriptional repressor for pyruvate dehydrogenase complex
MSPQPSPPFKALEQRRAFEQIIFQISEAITEGRVRPGDRLPSERELAETFGVSRASVREALRALEVFGVLVARRGTGRDAGSTVADSAGEGLTNAIRLHAGLLQIVMRDIVDIRAVLESFAARRAAEHSATQSELRDLIDRMQAAPDAHAYHGLDTDFHVALARASGNALLPVLMESLRSAMQRDMLAGFSRLEDWEAERDRLVVEHRHIVERIEAGDPDGAATALQDHIMGFYRNVMDSPTDESEATPSAA